HTLPLMGLHTRFLEDSTDLRTLVGENAKMAAGDSQLTTDWSIANKSGRVGALMNSWTSSAKSHRLA
ncbi:MAG TPA: hypothetical protein VIM63_12100, partial [Rhodoferax sp.]